MFMRAECRYYAPCGLCTYYNKPCDEVCGNTRKPVSNNDVFKKVDDHISLGTCEVYGNPVKRAKAIDNSKNK